MSDKNYNNDFFGWNGTISRKNYAINLLIVIALYVVLSFVNFYAFEQFIPIKFLFTVMVFMADLVKLVLVMCALSLVYRRIIDFSYSKTYKFQLNMKRLFVFLFVIPVLYFLCIRFFFSMMPVFTGIMDIIVIYILIPLAFLTALLISFIKGI